MKRYGFKFKTAGTALLLGLLTFFSSCTSQFDEYNKHPTSPEASDMTTAEKVGILFPRMLYLMHNFQENDNQMIEQMVGNQYGGYMVTTNNWQGTNFGTFNPSPGWVAVPFNKLFTGFYSNYFQVKEISESKGYIYAWANILRVAVMLRVVDTYGPIPYTQMGGGKLNVAYDSVEDIYHAMIDDLENSVTELNSFVNESQGKVNPMAEFDLIYGGDFSKWVKFANSLKLRMAVRIGLVDTDYATGVMASAIAGGCIESNEDNAFLPTTDNPYRKSAFDWGDLAVSATLTSYMNGWSDPRRPIYMTMTVNNNYNGVRMGINNISKAVYSGSGYSKPNFAANSPLLVYCAAETYFLMAEAALRGWIAGDVQALYETGVQTSMDQHGATIGTYLTAVANVATYTDPYTNTSFNVVSTANGGAVTVPWTNSATTTEKQLEKIITQKWLANYPLGFETWCDFRRTGYPRMIPAVNNLSSSSTGGSVNNPTSIGTSSTAPGPIRLARRLPYPLSEYNGNPINVQDAVDNLLGGPDEFATNLWWSRK